MGEVMNFKCNKEPNNEYYDLLFLGMELLGKIRIDKLLGNDIVISNIQTSKYDFSFSLNEDKENIVVIIGTDEDNLIFNLTLQLDNGNIIYEIQQNNYNVLSCTCNSYHGNKTISKTVYYSKNNIYTYELLDGYYNSVWLRFSEQDNFDDKFILNILQEDNFDEEKLKNILLARNFSNCLLKVETRNNNKLYSINKNDIKELDTNKFIENPVLIKVLKYN